jgi:hypothetical protein
MKYGLVLDIRFTHLLTIISIAMKKEPGVVGDIFQLFFNYINRLTCSN